MMQSRYSFFLEIIDAAGVIVHREEVRDFLPCYEDLLFAAVCSGQMANDGALPSTTVTPIWRDGEQKRVAGVMVSLPPLSKRYTLAVFADRVWEVLVNRERIKRDEQEGEGEAKKFTWRVEALERVEERKNKLRVSLSRRPYPLIHGALSAFGIARASGEQHPLAFFFSHSLLDELREETARSLDTERADLLTGHVMQEAVGQAALVVTGRIPALTETASSRIHFSFSPLTFLAAQQEAARRGETIVGWHHNHPPPCGETCLQYIPPCKTSTVFFSLADRAVHRASFAAPYMVALVSGKETEKRANDPGLQTYGWQAGAIQQQEFSIF